MTAIIEDNNGRWMRLNLTEEQYKIATDTDHHGKWDWLSKYQRRRMEKFFGKVAAYYTRIVALA
jgi:hypothetical protein